MSEEKKPTTIECKLCRKEKVWKSLYNKRENKISEWSKVCNDCEALWELGKKTISATKADGKECEATAYVNVPTDAKMGDPKAPIEIRGKDIQTAVGGVSLRGTAMGDPWEKVKGGIKNVSITGATDENDHYYISGGGCLSFKVPASRAEAMKRIIAGFYNAIAKARVDGFEEGRNLLLGLAKGDVSLETFSEQADNTRAGKKPRRRGDD